MRKQKIIVISILIVSLTFSSLAALASASYGEWNLNCNPENNIPFNTNAKFTAWTTYSGDCKVSFTLKHIQTGYTCEKEDQQITWQNGQYCADWTKNLDKEGDWKICATFYKKITLFWWTWWEPHECEPKTVKCCTTSNGNYWLECIPPCGSEIEIGMQVKATAKTTNSEIYKVNFTWINPLGQKVTETVTERHYYWDDGKKIYYFESTKTLDIVGDWCVKAEFIDLQGYCYCQKDVVVACRRCCFTVVPEIPVIGTVGGIGSMALGLSVFKARRKPRD